MADAPIMNLEDAARTAAGLRERVSQAIFGQEDLITETLCCFLAGGHILMTGAPGLAKTTLVRVFAQNLGLNFGRIQFTPDLLPADIVGAEVLNVDPQTGRRTFEFSPGPVFTNLLLGDEINRASPRTQSALLEAMQERRVTVGGEIHQLPQPFMVFATQNPFESEGTFPLPEAQLDRFLVHTLVPYPDRDAELKIFSEHARRKLVGEPGRGQEESSAEPISSETIAALMDHCQKVNVDETTLEGVRDLVRSTRPDDELCPESFRSAIWYGAGPRAGISLISTCQALALTEKQDTVRWGHVQRMAAPVLRHRLRLTPEGVRDGRTEDQVIADLMERLESRQKRRAQGES